MSVDGFSFQTSFGSPVGGISASVPFSPLDDKKTSDPNFRTPPSKSPISEDDDEAYKCSREFTYNNDTYIIRLRNNDELQALTKQDWDELEKKVISVIKSSLPAGFKEAKIPLNGQKCHYIDQFDQSKELEDTAIPVEYKTSYRAAFDELKTTMPSFLERTRPVLSKKPENKEIQGNEPSHAVERLRSNLKLQLSDKEHYVQVLREAHEKNKKGKKDAYHLATPRIISEKAFFQDIYKEMVEVYLNAQKLADSEKQNLLFFIQVELTSGQDVSILINFKTREVIYYDPRGLAASSAEQTFYEQTFKTKLDALVTTLNTKHPASSGASAWKVVFNAEKHQGENDQDNSSIYNLNCLESLLLNDKTFDQFSKDIPKNPRVLREAMALHLSGQTPQPPPFQDIPQPEVKPPITQRIKNFFGKLFKRNKT